MGEVEWGKELIKIAQEISDLKDDSESLAAITLITAIHIQLNVLNRELWKSYYYDPDTGNKQGEENKDMYAFYRAFNKLDDRLATGLASGQLILNKRTDIAVTAEGIFKTNTNY